MQEVTMLVLAGGESRRMGTDKADLDWGGQTFLEVQIQKGLELGVGEILVSGYRGSRCSVPVVPDRLAKKGPLGGLEAGLRAAKYETCLVVSVDMPLIPTQELARLVAFSRSAAAPIAVLRAGGRLQPLLGVYHKALADAAAQEVAEGKGSMRGLMNHVGYAVWESTVPEALCANLNTPEEYRMALQEAEEA